MLKADPPLFTLRGHVAGVSALSPLVIDDENCLVSGDEEGTVIVWDLETYREIVKHPKLLQSRIQSIKSVALPVDDKKQIILIVQSRNNGVQCFLVDSILTKLSKSEPKARACYPTYENLFTRGDAIQLDDTKAVLAYPALLENHMITVRILENDLKTSLSGSALRNKSKTCSVFDVKLVIGDLNKCLLFVAYEDGHLCIYSIDQQSTTPTVPELGDITGLKIDLVKDFDLKVGDFLSAFDVCPAQNGTVLIVCGSPLKYLQFIVYNPLTSNTDTGAEPLIDSVELKRKGVSAVCMRPDRKLVAVSLWDCSVRLYSLRSQRPLASLKNHSGRVQSIAFVERRGTHEDSLGKHYADKKQSNGQYILCCASQEGTISLSAIY